MSQTDFRKSNPNRKQGNPEAQNREGRQHPDFSAEFNGAWILNGVDQQTVSFANKVGRFLNNQELSTSQIRNVFGEIKRIEIKGFENERSSFYLLKPKMAYSASRVEKRNEAIAFKELKKIFDLAHEKVTNETTYKNFVDFFEALLAYHKAYGDGKNKSKTYGSKK